MLTSALWRARARVSFTLAFLLFLVFPACAIELLQGGVETITAPPGADELGVTRANQRDGAMMVFIPAGDFLMGSQRRGGYAEQDELPQHTVTLDGYWIYQNPVTVSQYRKFSEAKGVAMPPMPEYGWQENAPIVNVSWNDAVAYCKWAGVRLPSEAEWEKAARGVDGRSFPWGNNWQYNMCANSLNGYMRRPTPIGSFPQGKSPFGVYDMAGNVWQWCQDIYSPNYYATAPAQNPTGPTVGQQRVSRGGSFRDGSYNIFRSSNRNKGMPQERDTNVGFRCAISESAVAGAGVGQLEIRTDPPGARIILAGKLQGTSPVVVTVDHLADQPTDIHLAVEMTGYQLASISVQMVSGESKMRSIKLTPKQGNEPVNWINTFDGAQIVFVPAAKTQPGAKGFWIYKYPVTVAQYRAFCSATGRGMPPEPVWGWQEDHPVVNVSWNDAVEYGNWASARLPSRLEWQAAAYGDDGRPYPWGKLWDPLCCAHSVGQSILRSTEPVGSYPKGASATGVQDMAGNIWQWVQDTAIPGSKTHLLLGGSWNRGNAYDFNNESIRAGEQNLGYQEAGFRCVIPLAQ